MLTRACAIKYFCTEWTNGEINICKPFNYQNFMNPLKSLSLFQWASLDIGISSLAIGSPGVIWLKVCIMDSFLKSNKATVWKFLQQNGSFLTTSHHYICKHLHGDKRNKPFLSDRVGWSNERLGSPGRGKPNPTTNLREDKPKSSQLGLYYK